MDSLRAIKLRKNLRTDIILEKLILRNSKPSFSQRVIEKVVLLKLSIKRKMKTRNTLKVSLFQ